MKLYYREVGKGEPMIMLHGIFGSSDNWLTQARMLSEHYHTYAVDLRNHGHSPHAASFDYASMVDDIVGFMNEHNIASSIVMGHSMGGKVAMNLAVAHPDKVDKLIVVDIAPRPYDMNNFAVLDGLLSIPIDKVTSRQEADGMLARYVEEPDVRQFVLKNLQRKPEGGFRWKLNLPVVAENMQNIGLPLQFEGTFAKPALFVRGSRSNYVGDNDIELIKKIFPAATVETLATGHWVPAEKPGEFVKLVVNWLSKQAAA